MKREIAYSIVIIREYIDSIYYVQIIT